ncbi:protein FAM163A-like [Narcine bancroftii]|uniref:protein FAM163A-like n=1 Tax=Narcine bancroftii TaxID=1343680 RepID=UPI003831F667
MTAGTVVITGGILATVILLCIIGVLCYCRLQYYCCKKGESDDEEEDSDLYAHPHIACNACSEHLMDGLLCQPPMPMEHDQTGAGRTCPNCSPHQSPFYIQTTEEVRNGGERIAWTPSRCEELPFKMWSLQGYSANRKNMMRETLASTRAISTEV